MEKYRVYILAATLIGLLYMTREITVKPAAAAVAKYAGSRGLRNNNPGNIRWDGKTAWQGMTGKDDKGFVIFDTPENGIRAMVRILRTYANRGVDTISKIISTWAPSTENNVPAYIASVVQRVGKTATARINSLDYGPLVSAMIWHENGLNPYPDSVINAGIAAGLA